MGRQGGNPGLYWGNRGVERPTNGGKTSVRNRTLDTTPTQQYKPGFDEGRNHNPGDP